MFPKSKNANALRFQNFGFFSVSLFISGDLGGPESTIHVWDMSASRASVPKAPVKEDRYFLVREVEIRPPW
jgi:hypothetical protein